MAAPNGYDEWCSLVKKGKLDQVYLFTGKERYLKMQALAELAELLAKRGGLDRLSLEGKTVTREGLSEILSGGSIFSPQRLVVIKEADQLAAEVEEILTELIPHLPETTCLVIMGDGDGLAKRKVGKAAAVHGISLSFRPLYEKEALTWLSAEAKKKGVILTPEASLELVARVGNDTGRLAQELDKTAAYLGDKKEPITPQLIRELTGPLIMSVVFDLSEAITGSDSRKALRILEDLLAAGEAPVFLTSMLARQFHLLLAAKACSDRGLSATEAAPYLDHLPPFVLQRLYQQQRRFTWEALSTKLLRVISTDWRLKNGLAPVPAVEMTSLITSLL